MVFKCSVCGYVYDEEAEGKPFSELTECPMCKQPAEKFEPVLSDGADQAAGVTEGGGWECAGRNDFRGRRGSALPEGDAQDGQ